VATITPTYTANDGGAAGAYTLYRGVGVEYTYGTPNPCGSIAVTYSETPVVFHAETAYAAGAAKVDNVGNTYPSQIPAGTAVSPGLTFIGQRNLFGGALSVRQTPVTSADVRAFPALKLNPVSGTTFQVSAPVGSRTIVFAYPAVLPDPTEVIYDELEDDYILMFTKTAVNVEGANGATAASYKVFTWLLDAAAGAVMNFNVKIG